MSNSNLSNQASSASSTFAEGKILCAIWGHNKKNVEFFQVIQSSPDSIQVIQIDQITIQDDANPRQQITVPIKDEFIGVKITKYIDNFGNVKGMHCWNRQPVPIKLNYAPMPE